MQYLNVRATEGLLTIDSIPFQTLEFTHDIDSLKDLCTSLVRFESRLDEWGLIRMDAEHYLSSLKSQACSPKMLTALGDSLLDSLANFKAEPIEGELIINVIEVGAVIYGKGKDDGVPLTLETTEIGGVTHVDHVHEERQPRGRKRPLREAFSSEQITLKMPWQARVTDIDVLSQLARVHGIDNLGELVSVSNDIPGNTRLSHFTLTADSLNDRYHGTYTVAIEWVGRRPHRTTSVPEPVKENIDILLGAHARYEITLNPELSPSAEELFSILAEDAGLELPRAPLFMPAVWPNDGRTAPVKVQLYVSIDDNDYTGSVWVIVNWRSRARKGQEKRHISHLFNGRENHNLKMMRCGSITPYGVFAALNRHSGEATPDVLFTDANWTIGDNDTATQVGLSVSSDDVNYYGSLNVHINWV